MYSAIISGIFAPLINAAAAFAAETVDFTKSSSFSFGILLKTKFISGIFGYSSGIKPILTLGKSDLPVVST
ncbi:MAG: hypothetical protein IK147_00460, partial [Clostridia bacterium]|nr:hypothetical protein [Clostridia bacterium]